MNNLKKEKGSVKPKGKSVAKKAKPIKKTKSVKRAGQMKKTITAKKTAKTITAISPASLTDTEKAIIKMVCEQLTNAEIGEKLKIPRRTIDDLRLRLARKIGVKNTAGVVIYAIKYGLYTIW